jgi:hypothetical protein
MKSMMKIDGCVIEGLWVLGKAVRILGVVCTDL